MSILVEQLARMMAEITQWQAASVLHTVEFATLKGTIAYVQRGIWWMHEYWDYKTDADDSMMWTMDMVVLHSSLGISLSFVTKRGSGGDIFFFWDL